MSYWCSIVDVFQTAAIDAQEDYKLKQIAALYKAATTNDQVYNAHKYSPDLIGDKLWQIIKPHWSKFTKETQNNWMETFPDNSEPEDLPF